MSDEPALAPPARPKRPRRWLRVLTVASVALVVSLVLAELALRWIVDVDRLTPVANVYAADSVLGYRLKSSVDCQAMNQHLVSNSLGFRGAEWDLEPAEGVLRVALVGDSHAFGYGVAVEDAVAARLEDYVGRRLDAVDGKTRCEVLNFGVPGYNATQQQAAFEHVALTFSPDVVVLMPCNNDADEAPEVGDQGWLHLRSREMVERAEAAGSDHRIAPWQERAFDRHVRGALGELRLYRLANYVWLKYSMRDGQAGGGGPGSQADSSGDSRDGFMRQAPPAVSVEPRLETSVGVPLRRILRECQRRAIPVVMAPFAAGPQWRRLFADLAQQHGAKLVELLAQFPEVDSYAELQRQFGLGWDSHLGPVAHDRWARALAAAIVGE